MPGEKFELFDVTGKAKLHEIRKEEIDLENGVLGLKFLSNGGLKILEKWILKYKAYFKKYDIICSIITNSIDISPSVGNIDFDCLKPQDDVKGRENGDGIISEEIAKGNKLFAAYTKWYKPTLELLTRDSTWEQYEKSFPNKSTELRELQKKCKEFNEFSYFSPYFLCCLFKDLNSIEEWLRNALKEAYDQISLTKTAFNAIKNVVALASSGKTLGSLDDNIFPRLLKKFKTASGCVLDDLKGFNELLKIEKVELNRHENFLKDYMQYLLDFLFDLFDVRKSLIQAMIMRLQVAAENEDLQDGDFLLNVVRKLNKLGIQVPLLEQNFRGYFHKITESDFNTMHQYISKSKDLIDNPQQELRKLKWLNYDNSIQPPLIDFADDNLRFGYKKIYEYLQKNEQVITPFQVARFNLDMRLITKIIKKICETRSITLDKVEDIVKKIESIKDVWLSFKKTKLFEELLDVFINSLRSFFSKIQDILFIFYRFRNDISIDTKHLKTIRNLISVFTEDKINDKITKEVNEINKIFNIFISDSLKMLIELINKPIKQEPEHLDKIEKLLNNIINCIPRDKLQWFNKFKAFLMVEMDNIDYPKDHKTLKGMSTFLCGYFEAELKLDKENHLQYFNVYYLVKYLIKNLYYQPSTGFSLLEDIDKSDGGGNVKKWEGLHDPAEFHNDIFQYMNNPQSHYPVKRILFCMDKLNNLWGEKYSKFEEETFERYLERYQGDTNDKNIVFIHCRGNTYKEKYFLKRCECLFNKDIEQLNSELFELNKHFAIHKFDTLHKKLCELIDGFFEEKNLIEGNFLKFDVVHCIVKMLDYLRPEDKNKINAKLDKIIYQFVEKFLKENIKSIENFDRERFEKIMDEIYCIFPRADLGKKLLENLLVTNSQNWIPAVHLLIQKFGSVEQRSQYQIVWLQWFLQKKVSYNSFKFSHQLNNEQSKIDLKEIYKFNLKRALDIIFEFLQRNILDARVKQAFEFYFVEKMLEQTDTLFSYFQTVRQEYLLSKKVEDEIKNVLRFLHKNDFDKVPVNIDYLKRQLPNNTYKLYWDGKLLPEVEKWLIDILAKEDQNFSNIRLLINSFQNSILPIFPDSQVTRNLQFIIKNAEIIYNINRTLLSKILKPEKGKNWYHALLDEKLAREYLALVDEKPTKEFEERLKELKCHFINSFHCIFMGTSINYKTLLLVALDKLPVSFMVTYEREICLLLRKLLLPSMNVDSISLTNKLLDSIIKMLKLEKNGLLEYPSALLRNHQIQEKVYSNWRTNLRNIFNDIEGNDALGIVVHSISLGECVISPSYKDSLICTQFSGELLQLPPGQTHIVQQIGLPSGDKYYFKHKPDAPGDEYSVRSLYKLLLEPDMPQIDLFCFPGESGNRAYPVLASPGFRGETLAQYWNKKQSFKLDPAHFSRSVLMNLVTGPLDLKPENIIVEYIGTSPTNEPQYRLRSFDNDQCFMPPTYDDLVKDKLTRRLGIKTAVFCFDEMRHSLDQKVVEEFLNINIAEILRSWVIDVTRFNGNCSRLFSTEDCEYWALLPDKKAVVLIAQLEPNLIEQLYDKLYLLQDTLNRNRYIPAIELLNIIYPELGPYYVDSFKNELPAAERFKQIVANEYILLWDNPQQGTHYYTSTSIHTVAKARYGRLPDRKKEFLEPALKLEEERLNRLDNLFVQYSSIDDVVDSLLKQNSEKFDKLKWNGVKERVIERIRLATLPKDVQLFIFGKMLGNEFRHLDFSNCEFLTMEILLKIVQSSAKRLTYLKIVGCKNLDITQDHINQLFTLCEFLETFHIQLGKSVEVFDYEKRPWYRAVTFPVEIKRLRKLVVLGGDNLKTVKLDAPNLSYLKVSSCPKLSNIEASSSKIRTLLLNDCPQFRWIKSDTTEMARLQVTRCPLVKYTSFYEKYPRLFQLLNDSPKDFVQSLEKVIEKNITVFNLVGKPLPKALIESLVKLINGWQECFVKALQKTPKKLEDFLIKIKLLLNFSQNKKNIKTIITLLKTYFDLCNRFEEVIEISKVILLYPYNKEIVNLVEAVLKPKLNDEDLNKRKGAAEILAQISRDKETINKSIAILRSFLNVKDKYIRIEVIEILGKLDDPKTVLEAINQLILILNDSDSPDSGFARIAIRSFANLTTHFKSKKEIVFESSVINEIIEMLKPLLMDEKMDFDVRIKASLLLIQWANDPKIFNLVIETWSTLLPKAINSKSHLLIELGELLIGLSNKLEGRKLSMGMLPLLLRHENEYMRIEGIKVLIELSHYPEILKIVVENLRSLLTDKAWMVRIKASELLLKLPHNTDIIKLSENMLKDFEVLFPDSTVMLVKTKLFDRFSSNSTILKIALPVMLPFLKDEDEVRDDDLPTALEGLTTIADNVKLLVGKNEVNRIIKKFVDGPIEFVILDIIAKAVARFLIKEKTMKDTLSFASELAALTFLFAFASDRDKIGFAKATKIAPPDLSKINNVYVISEILRILQSNPDTFKISMRTLALLFDKMIDTEEAASLLAFKDLYHLPQFMDCLSKWIEHTLAKYVPKPTKVSDHEPKLVQPIPSAPELRDLAEPPSPLQFSEMSVLSIFSDDQSQVLFQFMSDSAAPQPPISPSSGFSAGDSKSRADVADAPATVFHQYMGLGLPSSSSYSRVSSSSVAATVSSRDEGKKPMGDGRTHPKLERKEGKRS